MAFVPRPTSPERGHLCDYVGQLRTNLYVDNFQRFLGNIASIEALIPEMWKELENPSPPRQAQSVFDVSLEESESYRLSFVSTAAEKLNGHLMKLYSQLLTTTDARAPYDSCDLPRKEEEDTENESPRKRARHKSQHESSLPALVPAQQTSKLGSQSSWLAASSTTSRSRCNSEEATNGTSVSRTALVRQGRNVTALKTKFEASRTVVQAVPRGSSVSEKIQMFGGKIKREAHDQAFTQALPCQRADGAETPSVHPLPKVASSRMRCSFPDASPAVSQSIPRTTSCATDIPKSVVECVQPSVRHEPTIGLSSAVETGASTISEDTPSNMLQLMVKSASESCRQGVAPVEEKGPVPVREADSSSEAGPPEASQRSGVSADADSLCVLMPVKHAALVRAHEESNGTPVVSNHARSQPALPHVSMFNLDGRHVEGKESKGKTWAQRRSATFAVPKEGVLSRKFSEELRARAKNDREQPRVRSQELRARAKNDREQPRVRSPKPPGGSRGTSPKPPGGSRGTSPKPPGGSRGTSPHGANTTTTPSSLASQTTYATAIQSVMASQNIATHSNGAVVNVEPVIAEAIAASVLSQPKPAKGNGKGKSHRRSATFGMPPEAAVPACDARASEESECGNVGTSLQGKSQLSESNLPSETSTPNCTPRKMLPQVPPFKEKSDLRPWELLRQTDLPPPRPEDNYEISEPGDSDPDDAADERAEKKRAKKPVPKWCDNYLGLLNKQADTDPDSLFGMKAPIIRMEEIFPAELYERVGKHRPKRNRGSSQDWNRDKLTKTEVKEYKRKMGQVKGWFANVENMPPANQQLLAGPRRAA